MSNITGPKASFQAAAGGASNLQQIRRQAKLKAQAFWRKVDELAKAEGLPLAAAIEKVNAANGSAS